LQELLAVLQSLWPLHLFTPKHFTSLSDPALTVIGATENKPAAATANATPVVLCTFMDILQQNCQLKVKIVVKAVDNKNNCCFCIKSQIYRKTITGQSGDKLPLGTHELGDYYKTKRVFTAGSEKVCFIFTT
jgi:hypothetical protein